VQALRRTAEVKLLRDGDEIAQLTKFHETDSADDSIELKKILDTITGSGVGLPGEKVSFLLTCPNCGIREVTDFGYGGEISLRPAERPSLRELGEYNYFRRNRAGIQREWWFHRSGCRAWFIAERDTTTNEVLLTELPRDRSGGGDAA
jgi:heterotetrameric sarcosine oxidase delta subunit